ncbi:VanZ family protein [Stieleria marina]
MTIFGVRVVLIVLVVYWLTIFAGTHLAHPPEISSTINDKVKHFVAYLGLTVLLSAVLDLPARKRWWIIVIAIVATYGIVDELTQQLVPGRVADVKDYVADLVGMIVGLGLYVTATKLFPAKSDIAKSDIAKSDIPDR